MFSFFLHVFRLRKISQVYCIYLFLSFLSIMAQLVHKQKYYIRSLSWFACGTVKVMMCIFIFWKMKKRRMYIVSHGEDLKHSYIFCYINDSSSMTYCVFIKYICSFSTHQKNYIVLHHRDTVECFPKTSVNRVNTVLFFCQYGSSFDCRRGFLFFQSLKFIIKKKKPFHYFLNIATIWSFHTINRYYIEISFQLSICLLKKQWDFFP